MAVFEYRSFNKILDSQKVPEEWRRSVPVPKEYYRCRICFEDVDTEVQRRSEEAAQRKHITGEELWNCMRKSVAAEKYVGVCMYVRQWGEVCCRCESNKVKGGGRTALTISSNPFLFAVVMGGLTDEVRHESPWTIVFADGIVIWTVMRG